MSDGHVAIYSLEWGINDRIPTYSGGLGVLNGDILFASADLGYPVVGVGLMYHKGFGRQEIVNNSQHSHPVTWNPETEGFERLSQKVKIHIYERSVTLGAWRKRITSPVSGKGVDLVLLDADVPENPDDFRRFNDRLYDDKYKLANNIMLGIGGSTMLEAMGYNITTHHMQEGHAATLTLKLLREKGGNADAVRELCVFTNHTPVEAGMPKFPYDDVQAVAGYLLPGNIGELAGNGLFNTNLLASNLSRYMNGVARKHAEVLRAMPEFAGRDIGYITNGVHWRFVSERMQKALDSAVAGAGLSGNWRLDSALLQRAQLDPAVLAAVHRADKMDLVDRMNESGLRAEGHEFDKDTFTIGFARRFAPYKRAWLPLSARLHQLPGDIQTVYAGKAHPNDGSGNGILSGLLNTGLSLDHNVRFGFLPDYNLKAGQLFTAGADLWVVAAIPHEEASGTSPMKAGSNGNPTISTDGGFWPEVEGRFGDVGYTFGGSTQEEEIAGFLTQLDTAMRDFQSGKFDSNRARLITQFWQQFSAARMMRQYAEAYGFEPKKTLERIVAASAA